MNFNKRQNAFCDIPGFDASKGERIFQALQKLWSKIQYLEQVRHSEKKSRSDVSGNVKDGDLTVTDIEYKLLILQLRYVRSLLRKKLDSDVVDHPRSEGELEENFPVSDKNNQRAHELYPDPARANELFPDLARTNELFPDPARANELFPDPASRPVSHESNYGNSSVDDFNMLKESDILSTPKVKDQASYVPQHQKCDPFAGTSALGKQRTLATSSKAHYHLNLNDIPFLLGASSTASHSVVANVQNIIAMMKSHNKVLCRPEQHTTRTAVLNPNATKDISEEKLHDVTKILNELPKELCDLASKQQKIADRIDAALGKKEAHELIPSKNCRREERGAKLKDKNVENQRSRRLRSNSESQVKVRAEVRNMNKTKEKDPVKSHALQKPSSSASDKSHTSNLSIMQRRKLLRSLQNFKTHLSAEDISWN